MNKYVHKKEVCGICGGSDFVPILDLGQMPVSNVFLKKEELSHPEQTFPLAVQLCLRCKSLQLSYVVSPKLIFKHYSYLTGASGPLVEHFHQLANERLENYIESPNELVLEIGSNDGSLIGRIKDKVKVLGIDPADNIAKIAVKNGVPTIVGFFN